MFSYVLIGYQWFSLVLVGFSFLCVNRHSRFAISHITHKCIPFQRYCRFSINVLVFSSAIERHVGPTCLYRRFSFDMVKWRLDVDA